MSVDERSVHTDVLATPGTTAAVKRNAHCSRRHRAIRADEDPAVVEIVAAAIDPEAFIPGRVEFLKRKQIATRQAIRAIKAYKSVIRREP